MNLTSLSPQTCPDHVMLIGFAEGTLTEQEATVVSDHLTQCVRCDQHFGLLEERSDDLVRALAMLPATDDDEATFQALQAELLAKPEEFGTGQGTLPFEVTDSVVPLELPMQLGSYELLEQIGAGANGAVFRARHRRLEKQVAIKLLLNVVGSAVEEFLHEMRVIGQLDHPHVIQATDAGEHEGIYFLVMEFVPGLDVSSLLRQHGPLSVANACEVIRQTALGLSFAHQNDLVHRDVKTSNLLFTAGGQIKLLDLGLATLASRQLSAVDSQRGPRGTADYMAPEQWREADGVTAKADIYSLGCTLFKLLTGVPPYRELPNGVSTVREAHLRGEIPSPSKVCRGVPANLDIYVQSMLAKLPEERPGSASEVATTMAKYTAAADLGKLARTVLPHVPPPLGSLPAAFLPTAPPKSISRRDMLLVAAAAAAGCAAIAWNQWGNRTRSGGIATEVWRPLRAVNPPLIPLTQSEDVSPGKIPHLDSFQPTEDSIQLECGSLVLVHLGRPLTGAFQFRAMLERPHWRQACGLFFRLRAPHSQQYDFQTFEVLYADSQWRLYWNSYRPGQPNAPLTLAESTLTKTAAKRIELGVSLGFSGFPDFHVDGDRISKSKWTFSREARDLLTAPTKHLAATYTGRIGVIHRNGQSNILTPSLMYLRQ